MSATTQARAQERERLRQKIAEQRGELQRYYQHLETPLGYAETGFKAISYLSRHPFIPLISSLGAGLLIKTVGGLVSPSRIQSDVRPAETAVERTWSNFAKRWGQRVWSLYQFYREIRPYFP